MQIQIGFSRFASRFSSNMMSERTFPMFSFWLLNYPTIHGPSLLNDRSHNYFHRFIQTGKICQTITMTITTILTIALLSNIKLSSSFVPAQPGPGDWVSTRRCRQLFQSSIAVPQEDFCRRSDSCNRKQIEVKKSRKVDVNDNAYSPTTNSATATKELDTTVSVETEERLTALRSMSLKELKLACSRRNIQYGKFLKKSEKEEYLNALWKDMEKAFLFSVTGLVQPGTMTELTEDQLEEELSGRETLMLVDVFATWCGPCRVMVPVLEVAAKKLVEEEVRVVKINADNHPSWAARHQVQGLPAILLMQGGRIIDRLEGTYTTSEISNFVKQHLP